MLLEVPGEPLRLAEVPEPQPRPGHLLIKIGACGVCRTDLHIRDGELEPGHLPLVPGHQIAGTVVGSGPETTLETGRRVGVPWLGWTCGECRFCRAGRENLCDEARFTGL